ncbi:MAG: helix-turn-helix transcriptional regulator [Ruminococcaceae bacterium]|nr:helix-turn-helix transcriptional regulator [Oscillospiraceae bacterium]
MHYNCLKGGGAMLFENERLNISKINNIVEYSLKKDRYTTYNGCLPTYELMYYKKGESVIHFGGKKIKMHAGSLLYLPKGLENNKYDISVKDDFVLYNIYFDTFDKLPNEPIQIDVSSGEIADLYEKAQRIWFCKSENYYFKTMQTVYRIFEIARRSQIRYNSERRFIKLKPSEEYMALHYCDTDFNQSRFIELSGLSYSYFKKLFIDKYGVPPIKYLTKLKMDRACELLKTGNFKISEVAELCGYENIYYFSNVFKKVVGVTPSEYKK